MSEWFSGLKFGRRISLDPKPVVAARPSGRPPVDQYRQTTQAERDLIRAWRRAGWTITRVHAQAKARDIAVSRKVVEAIVADLPAPRSGNVGRKGADPAKRAAVVESLASGMTHRAVAEAHGVSLASVWKWSRGEVGPRKPGPAKGSTWTHVQILARKVTRPEREVV
jgi:hypothetical protein